MGSTWYSIANDIWKVAKWIWTVVVIAILISVASSLFAGKQADALNSTVLAIIKWFREGGFYPSLILSLIGLFMLISLASGIIVFAFSKKYESTYSPPPEVQAILDYIKKDVEATNQRDEIQQTRDREAFTQYLRSIEELYQNIRPGRFAQLSRAMVFAEVPLNEIFVPLRVISDEPIYDAPDEQYRQFEAMRKRDDLSIEERDAYLQRLRLIWQSQLSRDEDVEQAQQPLLLDELVSRISSNSPLAILLGTPGSGKSTFLRWLALHMARASLTQDAYQLPSRLGREQVPILIQMREYAERLEKDYLPLKEFLILQWNRIHPNLALKLLGELSQGHCLVLFDGLDQVATVNVHKRLIEAVYEFIADYSSDDTTNYNRYIITSRNADNEPGAFAKYPHYTLLDLDRQRIEQILGNWCFAVARFQTRAMHRTWSLTEQEEVAAHTAGAKQQAQLLQILQGNPDLMRLTLSPMALVMMVLLQFSSRNLLQNRIELCQVITRTLLDNWNRESGRKMFSSEEIPLAEQLLSNLAYRLQESGTMLSTFDVQTITRHTLATFYQREPTEIKANDISQFIETLRRSSGLFVEGGEDLFYFANRTIQDYYVVLYLLQMPQEELKQFASQHDHLATWREPLKLMLIYKRKLNLLALRSSQLNGHAADKEYPTQPLIQSTPEDRATEIQMLQHERQLTQPQVAELLGACIDTRLLPEGTRRQLGGDTVQALAWKVLMQPFVLEHEVLDTVLRALDSSKAPICEGAAMLLQHSQALPEDIQHKATQKIWQLLLDDVQLRYPSLGYVDLVRLYDTLFKTLEVVTNHS